MFDFLAASNTREDVLLFGPSIRRDDEPDVLADLLRWLHTQVFVQP